MRRYLKKSVLESLKIIGDELQKTAVQLNMLSVDAVKGSMGDYQNTIIQIGNLIEQEELGAPGIVSILEDCCEVIYQIAVSTDNKTEIQNLLFRVSEHIKKAIAKVKRDIVLDHLVVAFLPYKASMWDSMESVWKEAVEDKECDPIVMPIPYYDKNADGSFGVLHDESDQYSKEVSIIDWRQTDLGLIHPDVIIIHNPYDNGNYVTSVHPDYYSKQLKKCCDKLFYIPYFVGIDDYIKEEMCLSTGIFFSDKVIVESEKVKKLYAEQYDLYIEENKLDKYFPCADEKFLVLGSPKYDKEDTKLEDNDEIMEDWKHLHSLGKKVILYNTSLAAFLEDKEEYLDKVESVLEKFRHSERVALWWRPHPLFLSTLTATCPNQVSRYLKLIDKYKEDKWGIYDTSSDFNRAIEMTDAYYGDMSSLVSLYEKTGKPIMIQNA